MIRTLFAKILRPKPVSDVLFCLDHLDSTSLAETLCWPEVKAHARSVIKGNPDALRKQVLVDGTQPMEVALNLVGNLCFRDLSSGHHHIYRGVLGMGGSARRVLFNQAERMAVERGYKSQEDADEANRNLAENIRDVG